MNKILVVADLIEHTPVAIRRACELAKTYAAQLHVVHFCHVSLHHEHEGGQQIRERVIHFVEAQAKKLLGECVQEGVQYTDEVVWAKHIDAWVCDYVMAEKPCLVIKTGHRSETSFYTPTDWRILRECQAPVMIVAEEGGSSKRGNILAAIDLESTNPEKLSLNKRILDEAKRLADDYQAQLHVCYTATVPPVLLELGIKSLADVESKAKASLKADVTLIADEYAIAEGQIHVQAGMPEQVIPYLAAEHAANVVVMGTVGRSGVTGMLFGNTAEKVIAALHADVLALKP